VVDERVVAKGGLSRAHVGLDLHLAGAGPLEKDAPAASDLDVDPDCTLR
jgi:hypothetical protein